MVEITDLKKSPGADLVGTINEVGGIKKATSKLKEAKDLVDSIQNIFGSVERLISPLVKKKMQQDSQYVNNPNPVVQEQAMQQRVAPGPPQQQPDNNQVEAYFSTPEGMNKIVEAIDKFTPLIGDAKLSEVKELLQGINKPEDKGKKNGN